MNSHKQFMMNVWYLSFIWRLCIVKLHAHISISHLSFRVYAINMHSRVAMRYLINYLFIKSTKPNWQNTIFWILCLRSNVNKCVWQWMDVFKCTSWHEWMSFKKAQSTNKNTSEYETLQYRWTRVPLSRGQHFDTTLTTWVAPPSLILFDNNIPLFYTIRRCLRDVSTYISTGDLSQAPRQSLKPWWCIESNFCKLLLRAPP